MRTLADGRLAVPYIDPQGSADPTQGAVAIRATDGTWSVVTTVTDHPPTHVFDVAEHAGRLYICGAVDTGADTSAASVWWSDDDGATWTWEPVVNGDGFARIFALAEHGGSLYGWGNNVGDPSHGRFVRNDTDGTWTREDTTGWTETEPVTLLGQQFVLGLVDGVNVGIGTPSLGPVCFPTPASTVATAMAAITEEIYDLHVSTVGTIYTLTSSGAVKRLTTDGAVATITSPLGSAQSVAVDETRQKVYLGTYDSKIYVASL